MFWKPRKPPAANITKKVLRASPCKSVQVRANPWNEGVRRIWPRILINKQVNLSKCCPCKSVQIRANPCKPVGSRSWPGMLIFNAFYVFLIIFGGFRYFLCFFFYDFDCFINFLHVFLWFSMILTDFGDFVLILQAFYEFSSFLF